MNCTCEVTNKDCKPTNLNNFKGRLNLCEKHEIHVRKTAIKMSLTKNDNPELFWAFHQPMFIQKSDIIGVSHPRTLEEPNASLKSLEVGLTKSNDTSPEDLKEHKSFSVPQEESVEMKEFFQKPKGPPELIESNLQRQLSQLNLNETDSITSRETAQTKITSLPADMLHRLDKTYDLQITRSQEAILDRIKKDLKVFRNYKDLNDEENDSLIEEH